MRTDADQTAVLELADRPGRRAGEPEQFLHLQLAPFLDDIPDVGLALGELGQLAGARRHAHEEAFAPARLLFPHGLGQHGLERNLHRAAVIAGHPPREGEHLGGDGTLLADDLGDDPQIRVRGFLKHGRDDAGHFARAEGHLHPTADLDAIGQLHGYGVIKFFAQGDFEGDACNHRR